MTASNANTSGLVDLIQSRIGQDFEGECHLTDDEARQVISALVTAASAQARIAELREQSAAFLDLHNDMSNRMVAAEARADRLAKALGDARSFLSAGSCWKTTEKWSANDFREHVRTGHLHLARLSNDLASKDSSSEPRSLPGDKWLKIATDAAWARNMDGATAMMVDLEDLYALISASRAALQQETQP